ncbi:hypothetical protein [Streptomyces albidoflavus]|uniref:hypothetical protein n=1 Tax=Streptomyces albidoflavus TaxID=1886 RepID=UPI0026AC6CAB
MGQGRPQAAYVRCILGRGVPLEQVRVLKCGGDLLAEHSKELCLCRLPGVQGKVNAEGFGSEKFVGEPVQQPAAGVRRGDAARQVQ